MGRQEVAERLAEGPPGTTLRLTYKEDCTFDPFYLVGMAGAEAIQFVNPMDRATIMAVQRSKNWGHSSNRTIEVVTTETFDLEWFVDRVARPLESLEVVE